jgi:hypothetical protein
MPPRVVEASGFTHRALAASGGRDTQPATGRQARPFVKRCRPAPCPLNGPPPQAEFWRQRSQRPGAPKARRGAAAPASGVVYGNDIDGSAFSDRRGDPLASSAWNLQVGAGGALGVRSCGHRWACLPWGRAHLCRSCSRAAIRRPTRRHSCPAPPPYLQTLPTAPGSCLGLLRGLVVPGVSSPLLYMGMLGAAFCWHTEDHYRAAGRGGRGGGGASGRWGRLTPGHKGPVPGLRAEHG